VVCGTVSSPFLCLPVRDIGLGVSLGVLLGIAQIFAFFLERKVRVLTDWTLELFFPRDIVQTIEFNHSGMCQKDPRMAVT
jgi:hypothetical protein